MTQEASQLAYDDEIDLVELFRTLLKRKWLIIGITALTTLFALAYSLIKTPIYEVKSTIQIGYIGNSLVAEQKPLAKILKIVYDVAHENESKDEKFVSQVSAINIPEKLANFIEIKTEGISNDVALKLNNEVVNYVQKEYKPKIDQYLINKNIAITNTEKSIVRLEGFEKDNLKRDIEVLKNQTIKKIDEQIKFLRENKIPTLEQKLAFHTEKLAEYTKAVGDIYSNNDSNNLVPLTVSSIQIVNYQNLILNSQNKIEDIKLEIKSIKERSIVDLERKRDKLINDTLRKLEYELNVGLENKKIALEEKIAQLKFDISDENVQNTKVVGDYIVKDSPAKPRKTLIVALGFILGLMFASFLVFLLEFIKNVKNSENENKTNESKEPKAGKAEVALSSAND